MKDLNEITLVFIEKVREFLGLKKIFGKIFIYDGFDYMKVLMNEMRQVKEIMLMFGIDIDQKIEEKPKQDEYINFQQNESMFDL